MAERHLVETTYRGKRCSGQWWMEDAQLYVENEFGALSGPALGWNPRSVVLPSETAAKLLWKLLRKQDPNRPFFDWY
jgi:hypothetical protein